MLRETASGTMLILLFLSSFVLVSNMAVVKGSSSSSIRRFRFLGVEQLPSVFFFVRGLSNYPNWNNSTDQYVSHIHFLSVFNYSYDDIVGPFWRGNVSIYNLEREFRDFLGEVVPGEIVIFHCGGHYKFVHWLLIRENMTRWLKAAVLKGGFVTVVLDTCSAGFLLEYYLKEYLPESVLLVSCGRDQVSYVSIFTEGIIEGLGRADDSNGDGWVSAMEVFPFAKNYTETSVTWDDQNPESYYGVVQGDLPLVQRDTTRPFPIWDAAVTDMHTSPLRVQPESVITTNITVENRGEKYAEFNVNLYLNSSSISLERIGLFPEETVDVTFTWSPTGMYGSHRLDSTISLGPGEINISDNVYYGIQIDVAIEGDVNLDREVNMKDIAVASHAYGSSPDHPRWNPQVDMNQDDTINLRDIGLIARNFGRSYEV